MTGESAIVCSTGAVTVISVVALIVGEKVAVIVAVPTETAAASPLLAAALLTLPIPGALEAQVTSNVRSWVVESDNVPFAANWVFKPTATDGAAGVIVSPVTEAELTVSLKVDDTFPTVAVRVAVPGAEPKTRLGIAVVNPATAGVSLDQTT